MLALYHASMYSQERIDACIAGDQMNRLATDKRTAVIAALIEGTSVNATCRMTGVAKHTVLKLLKDIGCACAAYHNAHVRNLRVRRVQADEIWSFVYGKDKNLTLEQVQSGLGSVWTWKAIDADTKLVISYTIGDRGADTAKAFMQDVASGINSRIQLTIPRGVIPQLDRS
jgi:tricorn protease-like protein